MAFCARCSRYLLLVFSFLLPVGGVLEAAWGGWWLSCVLPHRHLFEQRLLWPPALLVALAVAAALSAYLLWRAAGGQRLFGAVAVCVWLGALSMSHVALSIWCLVQMSGLAPPTDDLLLALATGSSTVHWDTLQQQLMCCGAVGPADYRSVDPAHLPTSCCAPAGPHQGHCESVFQRGCAQPLADHMRSLAARGAAAAACATVITISMLIVAAYYAVELKRRPQDPPQQTDVHQTLLRTVTTRTK